jgi:hypothetical protein
VRKPGKYDPSEKCNCHPALVVFRLVFRSAFVELKNIRREKSGSSCNTNRTLYGTACGFDVNLRVVPSIHQPCE